RAVTIPLAGPEAAGRTADRLVIDSSSVAGTLRLHASATAAVGTANGTVRGNGADGTASIAVTVTSRSLAIAVTPGSVTIPRAGQTTIQVDLTRRSDSGPVNITIGGFSAPGIAASPLPIDRPRSPA